MKDQEDMNKILYVPSFQFPGLAVLNTYKQDTIKSVIKQTSFPYDHVEYRGINV